MRKAGKISLMLGVVTGAVTGLLFAPQKGKSLRENIAKERAEGGLGHKAIARELAQMADDVAHLVKDMAQSEEARMLWKKTNSTVRDMTEGSVELDKWVKEAHQKADKLKKTVSRFAVEKKKYIQEVSGKAKARVKKATPKKAAPKKATPKKATPKKAAPKKSPKKSSKKTAKKK